MGRLNAKRGHSAGDNALQQVAERHEQVEAPDRLRRPPRRREFGVILPETDEEGAFLVAERLRRATRRSLRGRPLPLTISFGVAGYPEHGDQFGVLMGAAVRAVHAANELGRDRSVDYCADVRACSPRLPRPGRRAPHRQHRSGWPRSSTCATPARRATPHGRPTTPS